MRCSNTMTYENDTILQPSNTKINILFHSIFLQYAQPISIDNWSIMSRSGGVMQLIDRATLGQQVRYVHVLTPYYFYSHY